MVIWKQALPGVPIRPPYLYHDGMRRVVRLKEEKILIRDCREGDILAADVLNENGVKLLAGDTVINPYIKKRLQDFGVSAVQVYDPPLISKEKKFQYKRLLENYRDSVMLVKGMIHDLARGKTLDYGKVVDISNIIYDHIDDNDIVFRCLNQIRSSDEYTYSHSVNTSFYAMLISKWLGCSEEEIKKAIQAGFLHDIGKAKTPLEILNKNGPLTPSEFSVIKKHPVYGYYILMENRHVDADIKQAVLLHHERFDCTGYPFSIPANRTSLLSRIVSVADVYDAMTSDRVYKKKATPFQAFEMFFTSGAHCFDANVAQTFLGHISTYLMGCDVLLSTGEKGKIVLIPPQNILFPIVEVDSIYIDLAARRDIQIKSLL